MGTKKSNKLYAAAAALAVTASAVAPGLTADAASKVTVKSVTNPASISHYGGYTFAVKKLSLPKTVKVLLSNKKYENRSVKWGKVSYDKKYIGKYQTISGTVSGTTKKASIKVKLNNYPVDVVEPKLAPVAVGEKLNLPSTIDVKYKDGKVIARSAKSFNLTAEKTDKAGMMKLSYNYMGKNSSIKGSIAYEVKAAEITNVMDEVKDDMLSVSADVKYAAKDAKVEVLVYPGKDASKSIPFAAELKDGKLTAKTTALPAGSHSYVVKVGDVLSTPKDFSVEELKATVKAASSKTLEVSFNKVIDSTKAVVELKKDGFKVNAANITPSADKKSLIVELTSKITKGEYALNISGLSDKALEASVKTEDEKVAGLEILSDIAPITVDSEVDGSDKAKVGFKVVNQYGEDITKLNASALTVSAAGAKSAVANADGSIELTGTFKKDDKVVITLINGATATTTTKTVSISSISMAADVEFGALYNKDGKSLSENSDLSKDKFYLPVNVKDQYGKSITDLARLNGVGKDLTGKEVIVTNTNAGVATFGDFETQTINGKEVIVLPVTKAVAAGETNVIVIAKANGKNAQTAVKVTEGVRADSVSIGAPTTIVTDGKDVLFPLSVLDKEGKAITDLKVIAGTYGVKATGGTIVAKDGALYVQVVGEEVIENKPVTVVVTSSTNKVATQTIIPKAASEARVITGLKAGVSTAIRSGESVTLAPTDFIVEDQYGQTLSATEITDAKLKIVAESDNEGAIAVDAVNKLKLTAGSVADKVSANVSFKLLDKADSAFTKKFTVVKNSDFASYKVADLAPVYLKGTKIPAGYDRSIVVKAVTASGNEVTLQEGPTKDYTVKSTLLTGIDSDSKIDGSDAAGIAIPENETTAKAKVTVTINATGEEFVKEVTFSNVAPKIEKIDVVAQGNAAAFENGDVLKPFTAADYAGTDAFDLDEFFKLADVVVTDQYGVQEQVLEADETGNVPADQTRLGKEGEVVLAGVPSGTSTLTFTKSTGDVVFTSNGTVGAEASGKENDAFNVRYNLNGNAGSTIKVTATNNFSAQQN